jgi:hypothetical protein
MTRVKICHLFAPSSSAASSSSRGSDRKNCRRKNTPNAEAAVGTMTAVSVSSHCSFPTIR